MKKSTENKVQESIFNYINNNYCLSNHNPSLIISATPNGGYRNKLEAITLKKTGTVSGIADLTIRGLNSRFIDIEVKLPDEKQSPNQIAIQNKMIALNSIYIIVYSLEDFITKFEPHINFLTK